MTRWLRARGARARRGSRPSTAELVVGLAAVVAMVLALVVTLVPSTLDVLTPSGSPQSAREDDATEQPTFSASPTPTATPSPSETAPVPPGATPSGPAATNPAPTTGAPKITTPGMSFPSIARLDEVMGSRGLTRVPPRAWEGATFTVASYNVLGASHTRGPKRRKGYAAAEQRLPAQLELLGAKGVSVAGLQEFQYPQVHQLRARTGDAWGIYPGVELGNWLADNSIVWRTDQWEALTTRTVEVPYFRGKPTPMPYVLLEHLESGRRVWFANFHNPANVAGDAAHLRAQALQIEAKLAKELSADGTPVVVTGDMNDRKEFACPFATASGMHSPNGVTIRDGSCVLPPKLDVDWIFGTQDLTFSDFQSDSQSQGRKLSDHPLITSTAALPGVEDRTDCEPRISRDGVVWYCPAN
ncbi:MAG TPA: endonuclease/exonuclease/phosphatase family protein [Nocardioides sp.]|uniref:endonuclease/exonuclease/phosphatase family protein n=1 Tax=Nocardioides sp. TaxID=35761 RepID=UPI002B8C506A|nr:endonuclease/exonuclease/phosphatase family protein [Nocardioides sp.]HTW15703.1 endonuclease/exonuclease/phosphatase family protein [Nocardioides sp.]